VRCKSPFRETSWRCHATSVAGGERDDLRPAMMGHEPGQGSQPHPVGGPIVHPRDPSTQHGVFVELSSPRRFHPIELAGEVFTDHCPCSFFRVD
jgi:hypothetical protein